MEQKQFAPTPIFGAFAVSLVKPAQLDNFFLVFFEGVNAGRLAANFTAAQRCARSPPPPASKRLNLPPFYQLTSRETPGGIAHGKAVTSAPTAPIPRNCRSQPVRRFAAPSATRSKRSGSVMAGEVGRHWPRPFAFGGNAANPSGLSQGPIRNSAKRKCQTSRQGLLSENGTILKLDTPA